MRKQEKQTLEIVLESLRTYRGLNVTYRDLFGHVSSRAILPFVAYRYGDQAFVLAFCWLAKDARDFALRGILRIALRPKTVDKAVYIGFRDQIEELGTPLTSSQRFIACVNLED